MKNETAIFGGGCFWCTEALFQKVNGVIFVTPGYAGGEMPDPSYEKVSEGTTGHAEVICIVFDPAIITYSELLDIFLHTHDPTTANQQGHDMGTQYRSLILYTTPQQEKDAKTMLKKLEDSKEFNKPIVTEIKPLDTFFPAESYHLDYYKNNEHQPYCQIVISPKLQKLKEKYFEKLKKE